MASPETYIAVLLEVKRQLHLASRKDQPTASSEPGWVEVPSPSKTATLPSDAWPQQQWCLAFEILFYQIPASIASSLTEQATLDDLLMFVYTPQAVEQHIYPSPIFARRRSKDNTLPTDLQWGSGFKHTQIDWKETLVLNIVLHTVYTLTVCKCKLAVVSGLASVETGGSDTAAAIVRISKSVHASPSKVTVNIDDSKSDLEEAPTVSYPDVCFAVDDFSEAFKSMVLKEADDCYSVLLHANVQQSWQKAIDSIQPSDSNTATATKPARSIHKSPLLFSGYVSQQQLHQAVSSSSQSMKRTLGFIFHGQQRKMKVVMHGPAGLGHADVAVSLCTDEDNEVGGNGENGKQTGDGDGQQQPAFVQKAMQFGRRVAIAAKKSNRKDAAVQAALMTLAVPVDMLASGIIDSLQGELGAG